METGFEAANGTAEKVLGVKLPVLMRIVFPGLLTTAVLYPLIAWMLARFPSDSDHLWELIVAYAVLVFLFGAMISTANSEIYKIYEGRTLWPNRLLAWARQRQQARVTRLLKAAKNAPTKMQYDELWYQLRDYPLNGEGNPAATHPTMLGNILAGYEQYPKTRYGMSGVFFWSRIWLQIDKHQKEEIDGQWCVADGFLTLSAISFAGGAVWVLQALAATFGIGLPLLPFRSPSLALVAGLGWVVLGFLWYRLSIPFHRQNGELFKSVFDVYRHKVRMLTSLKPGEKERWRSAWAYLQYLKVQCPNCHGLTSTEKDTCQNCDFGLLELKTSLRDSGRFPPE